MTDATSYPRNELGRFGAPGTWRIVFRDGRRTAILVCPGCGANGSLEDHEIADDGTVRPSVVCDCGHHEHIRLAGWSPPVVRLNPARPSGGTAA